MDMVMCVLDSCSASFPSSPEVVMVGFVRREPPVLVLLEDGVDVIVLEVVEELEEVEELGEPVDVLWAVEAG